MANRDITVRVKLDVSDFAAAARKTAEALNTLADTLEKENTDGSS